MTHNFNSARAGFAAILRLHLGPVRQSLNMHLFALRCRARAGFSLPYDVGPARVFLGEAEKTPWLMCGLGPASRVKVFSAKPRKPHYVWFWPCIAGQALDYRTRVPRAPSVFQTPTRAWV